MTQKQLDKKLRELRLLADQQNLNIDDDISRISAKLNGDEAPNQANAWNTVQLARHPDRPTTLDYLDRICDDYMELHGDRAFGDDPAMVGGIARIGGIPFTFFGHQKGRNMKENIRRNYGSAHPEGYRKALRLAQQAEKFGRPIVSFIDTQGAYPGITSEERGISEAIARNLKIFSRLKTPIISIITGEGASGGAIGIAVCDKLYMMENSFYSVISPEGCASILLRDPKQAQYAAGLLKMTSMDLRRFGMVDGIIAEPEGGAHTGMDAAARSIKNTILGAWDELSKLSIDKMLKERSRRLLSYGQFNDLSGGNKNTEAKPAKQGFFQKLFKRS